MTYTECSLPLPHEVTRGDAHCPYGAASLRRSGLLGASRPWQVVANHVPRGEVPVSSHRP